MTALDDLFGSAAEARAKNAGENGQSIARNLAARPSQRRAQQGERSLPVVGCRAAITLTRAAALDDGGNGGLTFDGFASVYNRGYEMWDMFGPYTEQVTSGAGATSLATPDLDVPFVLDHDSMRRIARTTNGTLSLSETTGDLNGEQVEGLRVRADLDPADADVSYIAPKLESGLIDEMSFRFRITSGEWSPDWSEYHINGYDINRGDTAIVGYGANPFTAGSGLRSLRLEDMSERALAKLLDDLHRENQRRGIAPEAFAGAWFNDKKPAPAANSQAISFASLTLDD